jgi:hypothetical protein
MAWLLREGEVLASCVTLNARPFARVPVGILEGSQVLPAQRVCFVRRSGADIAVLDCEQIVITLVSVGSLRPVFTRGTGEKIIVAQYGAFSRWNLAIGDRLEIR